MAAPVTDLLSQEGGGRRAAGGSSQRQVPGPGKSCPRPAGAGPAVRWGLAAGGWPGSREREAPARLASLPSPSCTALCLLGAPSSTTRLPGPMAQSKTHRSGSEPSAPGSGVRFIEEAIGRGVGRDGAGLGSEASLLLPPSLLCSEEPTSKASSAAASPQPTREALVLGLARPGSGPGAAAALPT